MTTRELPDLRHLQTELSSPGFFAMVNSTPEPVFKNEQRIRQLLSNETTAGLLLEVLSNNRFTATEQHSTKQRQEQERAASILRACSLAADVAEPKVRVKALSLLTKWLMERDIKYASFGMTAKQPYDDQLEKTHAGIIERLATFPPEQSTAQNCATMVDVMARSILDQFEMTEAQIWRARATLLYTHRLVRERFAEQYLGSASTTLERAEYAVDAGGLADPNLGRNALLNDTTVQPTKGSYQKDFPFINLIRKNGPAASSTVHKELSQALFRPDDAQHELAIRLLRKQLLLGQPIHNFLEILKLAALAAGLPFQEISAAGSLYRDPKIKPYLAAAEQLILDILGETGVQAFHDTFNKTRLVFPDTTKVKSRNNIQLVKLPLPGTKRLEYRAVAVWDTATWPVDRLKPMVELSIDVERTLRDFATALVADIRETTLALGETITPISLEENRGTWLALSKTSPDHPFPARCVRLIGTADSIEFTLNEQLEFVQENGSQLLQLARSYVIAALHDQLSFSQVTTVEPSASQPSPARPTRPNRPVTEKPPRVRRLKNLIVIAKSEVDANTAMSTHSSPDKPDEVTLMVDRKPHWADLAPELTKTARAQVLADLEAEGLLVSCTAEQRDLLSTALTGPNSNLLSGRKILTHLSQRQKSDGTPILPDNLPLKDIIARFTPEAETDDAAKVAPNSEASYYQQLLTIYAGEDINFAETGPLSAEQLAIVKKNHKPAGRLPAILPKMRQNRATGEEKIFRPSIGQRIEADKAAMAEAGVDYQIPDRRLPTQTYVPYHRMTAIPITERIVRKKEYTIIKAESAVAALKTLLQKPAQAE